MARYVIDSRRAQCGGSSTTLLRAMELCQEDQVSSGRLPMLVGHAGSVNADQAGTSTTGVWTGSLYRFVSRLLPPPHRDQC